MGSLTSRGKGERNSSEDRKGCWREGNQGDRVPQEQRNVTVEESRLKHAGRNVPPPPLPSPNVEAWEEMGEEEEEEGGELTWVKVEVGPMRGHPTGMKPPWSIHGEDTLECSKLWKRQREKTGKEKKNI